MGGHFFPAPPGHAGDALAGAGKEGAPPPGGDVCRICLENFSAEDVRVRRGG